MSKVDFESFVENQINLAAQIIATKKSARLDDAGFGKLGFYLAVRRGLKGTTTPEDLGLLDAINDSLQELGLLGRGKTFLGANKGEKAGNVPPSDSDTAASAGDCAPSNADQGLSEENPAKP